MSYESVELSNPLDLFWRLDMIGPATNGDSIPDISTNDRHGTLTFLAGGIQPYGWPSPIQTDSSSSAFRPFNAGQLVGNTAASISRASDSGIEYTGDLSLGCFINPTSQSLATTQVSKRSLTGLCFAIGINANGRFQAILRDSAATTWTATSAGFGGGQDELFGKWFYVVVTRQGNVLTLWINAAINMQTTITSGLPTLAESGDFLVGAGISGPFDYQIDEVTLRGYALTGPQILAQYEAALSGLLLTGYSNVVVSAILYSDEDLPPISFPFRHNWSEPLLERISFATNISKSKSGAEENGQGRPKPRREIEIAQLLRDDSERRKLRAKLWANQHRKWFIPIREDFQQLTSLLSSGGNSIPVTTQYKDYEVDSFIGVRELNDQGVIVKSEELEIQTVNPTSIVTKTNLVNSYSANVSFAYPVRRAYLEKSIPVRGHTDAVEGLSVVARLLAEDEKTVPNRITPWTPSITRLGYEVFDPAIWQGNDWSEAREYDVDREIQDVDFDLGTFGVDTDTPGAAEAFTYRMPLKGRDKQAEFLGWFYARSGSLNYLWVPSVQKDFEIVSAVGSDLTVEGVEYSENYALAEARRDLAFVYFDNTVIFRRVVSFSGSPDETLVLDATVPTQTNLRSVSLLKFCRLDGDQIEIARITDDLARFAWRFRELLFTPS